MRVILEHRLSSLMAGRITVITALLHSGHFDRALITLTLIKPVRNLVTHVAYPSTIQMADMKVPVQCPAQSVQSKAYV